VLEHPLDVRVQPVRVDSRLAATPP